MLQAVYLLFLVVGISQMIVLWYKVPPFFTAVSVIVIGFFVGYNSFMVTKYLKREKSEGNDSQNQILKMVQEDEQLLAYARTVMIENSQRKVMDTGTW